jgi:hypothetical protein
LQPLWRPAGTGHHPDASPANIQGPGILRAAKAEVIAFLIGLIRISTAATTEPRISVTASLNRLLLIKVVEVADNLICAI